jgi:hypothetical protein
MHITLSSREVSNELLARVAVAMVMVQLFNASQYANRVMTNSFRPPSPHFA